MRWWVSVLGEVVGILMGPRQRRFLTTTGLVVCSLLALVVWPPMTLGAFGASYAGTRPYVTVLIGVVVLPYFVFFLLFYMFGMFLMGVSEKSVTIGYGVLGLRFATVEPECLVYPA